VLRVLGGELVRVVFLGRVVRLTVVMRTQRIVAKTMMTMPPLKSTTRPLFFQVGSLADHSMGRGIDIRYRSVRTLPA
jgi:hypothetical protein